MNLLKLLEREDDIKVYLYLLSDHGKYMNMIPDGIERIQTSWLSNCIYAKPTELTVIQKIVRLFAKCARKVFGDERIITEVNKRLTKRLFRNSFDVAIGFSEGEPVNFIAEAKAEKKYAWIHNDYSNLTGTKAGYDYALEMMNNIFFVAEAARKDFSDAFPQFKSKLRIIKNTIDFGGIVKKAEISDQEVNYNLEKINIVSVGRVSKQKAFERIPEIITRLSNVELQWHIIGDGDMMLDLRNAIQAFNVEGKIVLHGSKQNPYPYVNKADLLVVTSLYESQPMVILEALTLGVPVISTNFTSARELLYGNGYGMLCDNSVDGIANAIEECLKGNNLDRMRMACREFEYDNKAIVKEIISL
ncbi:glycosyltransferase [Enterococcus dongliensis]|uniref:glycosyltransferase n=1 Tax=Enterococcus dongliensis TaxID=2559925 RepID=UPI0028A07BC3|nr:glycosyltransferase [Enterococcus dongliensis]